ncbi:MAG: hypothetical protein HUU60_04160 [Armatimonadetes bacterium]|nr:hypothetical protein [Armatimonadota bacterium]
MRIAMVLASALALTAASVAQPSFTHEKRIDLTPHFTGNPIGDLVSDVAFDGTNAYVIGARSASGLGPVGVVKVNNVLGSHSLQDLLTLDQDGVRDAKIVYHEGNIYIATGMGNATGNPATTGVRKYDTSGNQDVLFSTDGQIMPAELDTSARLDGLGIDPGVGGGPMLAIMCRGRGIVFRADLASGAYVTANRIVAPTNPNTWRDVAFDRFGQIYARMDNDVFYGRRTSATTLSGNTFVKIIDLPDSTLRFNMNTEYFETTQGDRLVINSRELDTNNDDVVKKALIYAHNGTAWALEQELTGAEPLPDNSVPEAFRTGILSFTSADVGGQNYLFIAHHSPRLFLQADINGDGIVDDTDLAMVLEAFGNAGIGLPEDVNDDGVVDDTDLAIVLESFGMIEPPSKWLDIYRENIDE